MFRVRISRTYNLLNYVERWRAHTCRARLLAGEYHAVADVGVVVGDGLPDGHEPLDGARDGGAHALYRRSPRRLAARRHQATDLFTNRSYLGVF